MSTGIQDGSSNALRLRAQDRAQQGAGVGSWLPPRSVRHGVDETMMITSG
jgi:hypothetical protein